MNHQDIILIYPKTGMDTPDTLSLPLSLLLISSRLVNDHRFRITILDQRVDRHWRKTLKHKLQSSNVLCVGISTMTGTQIRYALRAAEIVRGYNDQIPLIWGGIHPTLTPFETINDPLVDIVVIGEGEDTFPELVSAIHDSTDLRKIPGLIFTNNSHTPIKTEDRLYADLDNLPEIPYYLVDIKEYFYDIVGEKALPVLFSRGCPHRCGFCYRSNFPPPKWRPMSVDKIIKEILNLRSLGAKTIIPLDDNFFVDKDRVVQICELLQKHDLSIQFHVNCRIDYADNFDLDYLRFLKANGFVSWDFGIESGCQRTLDFMNKDIKVHQISRVNEKLKEVGIVPTYSFMGGFPEETYQDLKETIDLMFRLIGQYPEAYLSPIKIYTPFPSTKMIENLDESYFSIPKTFREWANYDYNNPQILWHSKSNTKILEKISYYSYFIDPKRISYIFNKGIIFKSFFSVYKNLARKRLMKDFFRFPIDFYLMKIFYFLKKLV